MIEAQLLLLLPLALLAFFLKGLTSFGAGIVLVPLGALLIGVKEAVLLIGVLDLISNAWLYRSQKIDLRNPYLIRMSILLVVGAVAGVFAFTQVDASKLEILFAALLIPLGVFIVLSTSFGIRRSAGQPPGQSGDY